ncbi:DUF2470 domain-containing protein [Streptomyces xinghaiensis]|uniref:DUF2470 domain-containing protein n=1 Tax=Streptomyces xinghaiensis TaxID=1038928 RepID=UPI0005851DD0|nr:DUF2470 domain-containing protein [Streptomyces xinghaiensis]MZE77641.1 DUF2470 domain-containing protein [Streptomyces sp. SID5475]
MFRPGSPMPGSGRPTESVPAPAGTTGQPRPWEDARQPTAAERVRTLAESNASAVLTIPGTDSGGWGAGAPSARAVTADGDVLLLMPGDSPAARAAAPAQDDELTALIEISDVAPVAVPHRIRGRAWLGGWLTPLRGPERAEGLALLARTHPGAVPAGGGDPGTRAVLRLEVGEAAVDDLWGAEPVEPDAFAAAVADPLAGQEAVILQHLATAHGDALRGLCGLLGERADRICGARGRGVPLSLDRFGLRVRFTEGAEPVFDARFDFPEPVRDVTEVRHALGALFTAADGDR